MPITDKRIIRCFMTISEAGRLVILAGAMTKRRERFMLDMGRPGEVNAEAEKNREVQLVGSGVPKA